MKYLHYKTENFLADKKFKEWVLSPNQDSDQFWKSFLNQYPNKKNDVLLARQIIASLKFEDPKHVIHFSDEELEYLIQDVFKLSEKDISSNDKNKIGVYSIWNGFNWVSRAASIILLGLSFGILWLMFTQRPIQKQVVEVLEIIRTTEKGQKLTVYLDDGTVVRLNSGSNLYFPEHFDSIRTVRLIGEAFFDVVEDPNRPFEVYSQGTKTTVLGTKFGIKSDIDKGLTNIALLEGKVKVESVNNGASEHRILLPREVVQYSSIDKTFENGSYDYKSIFGWKEDILVFNHDGFDDVVSKLENWYGVKFEVNKQVSPEKDFTGEYHNEILKNVLIGMAYSFDIDFVIKNKTVIIN